MTELRPSRGLSRSKSARRIYSLLNFVIFIVLAGLFFVLFTSGQLDVGRCFSFPFLCVWVAFILVVSAGLPLGVTWLYRRLRAAKVPNPRITISDHPIRVGQEFSVTIEQTMTVPAQVDGITIRLILRESVRYSVGTERRFATHDQVYDQVTLPGRRFEAGNLLYESARLRIPMDGMHSWFQPMQTVVQKAQEEGQLPANSQQIPAWVSKALTPLMSASRYNNTIEWLLQIQIKVRGWLDFNEEYAIEVLPERIEDGL